MDDNAVEVIRRLCDAIDQLLEVEARIPSWGIHYASGGGQSVAARRQQVHDDARRQVEIARQLFSPASLQPSGG